MRAGFLGQTICSLGFGIATLQAPRLVMDEPVRESLTPPPIDESPHERASRTYEQPVEQMTERAGEFAGEKDTLSTASVTNPQRLCV